MKLVFYPPREEVENMLKKKICELVITMDRESAHKVGREMCRISLVEKDDYALRVHVEEQHPPCDQTGTTG